MVTTMLRGEHSRKTRKLFAEQLSCRNTINHDETYADSKQSGWRILLIVVQLWTCVSIYIEYWVETNCTNTPNKSIKHNFFILFFNICLYVFYTLLLGFYIPYLYVLALYSLYLSLFFYSLSFTLSLFNFQSILLAFNCSSISFLLTWFTDLSTKCFLE